MKKVVLSFIFLLSVFITNASEEISAENTSEILKRIATEVDPNQAQKKLRIFFKGDEDKCVELFQQAIKEENAVAQIYLSDAHSIMQLCKDSEKDFTKIKEKELEAYKAASQAVEFLKKIHKKINPSLTWSEPQKIAYTIVQQAEERGSIYAKFIQILENRFNPSFTPLHFGIACKLKPLINQVQFPELLFNFGISLFNSYHSNPQLGLEGLKYMEQSGLLDLHFFDLRFFQEKTPIYYFVKNFEEYCSIYINNGSFKKGYYDAYGMRFVGQATILIPRITHWKEFKKEKLDSIQPSPDSLFDLFKKHDMEKITALANKYKLDSMSSYQGNLECISINSFADQNCYKRLGKIKMNIESKNISVDIQFSPDQAEELSPLIDFLKDALFRCESSNTVVHILRDLRWGKKL